MALGTTAWSLSTIVPLMLPGLEGVLGSDGALAGAGVAGTGVDGGCDCAIRGEAYDATISAQIRYAARGRAALTPVLVAVRESMITIASTEASLEIVS